MSLQTTISKYDGNGEKFFEQIQNTMGKVEIVHYE